VARGTAIGSAVAAFSSLGWNIFAWVRQGPVLRLRASCAGRGDKMKISGRISNSGGTDAHLESGLFRWEPGLFKELTCPLPADHLEGMTLPTTLAVQTAREFTVFDLSGIDPGLAAHLHNRRLATLRFKTQSGKVTSAGIKYRG
jgi:hypothetical protein